MRCMKLAMQKLFTKEQWDLIETEAKFRVITLDKNTDEPVFLNKTDFIDLDSYWIRITAV